MDTNALPLRSKIYWLLVVSLFSLYLLPQVSTAGIHGNSGVSSVNVLPENSLNYTVGIDWESGRKLTSDGNEYDNIRLRPLGIRYGYWKNLQLGTDLRYSSNSASTSDGPDNSGLESINVNTKYRWNRNFALETFLGFGISNDVFPYGGDGFQFGLNLPLAAAVGPGSLIGELGYTLNSGEVSPAADWSGYFNYGIGYQYTLTKTVALKSEIAGHGSTVDPNTGSGESHLAFRIVPTVTMSESTYLTPSLTIGFSDGSPDFALGVDYTMRFGETSDRRVPFRSDAERDRRRRDRGTEETQADEEGDRQQGGRQPLVLPGEVTDETPGSQRDPQRAQSLAEKGRNAFKQGDLDRALSHFEDAVQYDPSNVEILSNLGSLHYRKNNYEQARTYYKRAIEADPEDQYAQLFLGITLRKLDRSGEARRHLEKARDIDPSSDAGRKAAALLEDLEK